jgi:hypothetical protein
MSDDTDALLAEREKTHGDFTVHSDVTQYMKDLFRFQQNWAKLTPAMKESLDMIAHKIGRIMAGTASHNDHWDDIAGYARLVSLRITEARNKRIRGKPTVAEVDPSGNLTQIVSK